MEEQIRTGGARGGWKLLFGELAELGEEMLPLEGPRASDAAMVDLRVQSGSNI